VGIKIDTLKVSQYRIDGLYIKLDKKLTLKADKVVIPKRKANPSFGSIGETFERIKYLFTFFENIDLKEIDFDNNMLAIYFRDNILQLSSNDYLIRANIQREGKLLKGEIPILQLKKHDLLIKCTFTYDLHEDILDTKGTFLLHHIAGSFKAKKEHAQIGFHLNTKEFTDLKSAIEPLDIPQGIKSWIVDKVQAKRYKLHFLEAEANIENKTFQMDMATIKAEGSFFDTEIDFKKGLSPIKASSFTLHYTDKNGLFFDLEKPTYKGKDLSGSTVSIINLKNANTMLKLNLKIHTTFDKTVQDLLTVYGIKLPILQKKGITKASVDIDIGLKNKYNHTRVSASFTQGDIWIKKMKLPLMQGSLTYENEKVILTNMIIKDKQYAGTLNGKIDIKNKELKAVFDTKYLYVGKKNNRLVSLTKQKLPFTLDYKKALEVSIPKLALHFSHHPKKSTIMLKDLNKVKPFLSPSIPLDNGGEVHIDTKDFVTFVFKGKMKRKTCFLYENKESCKTILPFYGTATAHNVEVYALQKKLYFNQAKSRIKLENINIDLKKFLARKNVQKTNTKKKQKHLVIVGKNSHLRYDNYQLITDSYDVEVKPNGDIKAIGSAKGDIVKFRKKGKILSLQALRIKDEVLHPLIDFDGLQNGRYSLTKKGNPSKEMKGEIIVEGGVMKGFKAYNNTLAFINTLPALATLHRPGYSDKGFTIKSGVVQYRMIKSDKIIFDSIYINGESATIVGKGEIDLKKKTIHVELGIQVARELGKMIGSIPLVGYILVGKEQSLTVGLSITGKLNKPTVSVSAAKDILSYPLELIKRTIEAPHNLLNQSQ
jgi:hypothetical protein